MFKIWPALRRAVFAGLCLVASFGIAAAGEPAKPVSIDALVKPGQMRRGVNVLGYDGIWKGEIDAPFRIGDFKLIRDAGFDHVRINFFGFSFMNAEAVLDGAVLGRLDRVIDAATASGLTVVLDQHDNELCQRAPGECKARLVAFWRQISARYAKRYPRLVYEILNEPGGHMTTAEWNETLNAALAVVRAREPRRIVIAAALNAGDPRAIEKLELPAGDRRLIVTFHYYQPMQFTHQGAPWSPEFAALRDVEWGSDAERAQVIEDFGIVSAWAQVHQRPVYLGEFGVYDKAPAGPRALWTSFVAGAAAERGWGWAYWQFDHDFALFDSESRQWNRTVLDALMR